VLIHMCEGLGENLGIAFEEGFYHVLKQERAPVTIFAVHRKECRGCRVKRDEEGVSPNALGSKRW